VRAPSVRAFNRSARARQEAASASAQVPYAPVALEAETTDSAALLTVTRAALVMVEAKRYPKACTARPPATPGRHPPGKSLFRGIHPIPPHTTQPTAVPAARMSRPYKPFHARPAAFVRKVTRLPVESEQKRRPPKEQRRPPRIATAARFTRQSRSFPGVGGTHAKSPAHATAKEMSRRRHIRQLGVQLAGGQLLRRRRRVPPGEKRRAQLTWCKCRRRRGKDSAYGTGLPPTVVEEKAWRLYARQRMLTAEAPGEKPAPRASFKRQNDDAIVSQEAVAYVPGTTMNSVANRDSSR